MNEYKNSVQINCRLNTRDIAVIYQYLSTVKPYSSLSAVIRDGLTLLADIIISQKDIPEPTPYECLTILKSMLSKSALTKGLIKGLSLANHKAETTDCNSIAEKVWQNLLNGEANGK